MYDVQWRIDDLTTVPYIGYHTDSTVERLICTTALPDDGPVRPEICKNFVN